MADVVLKIIADSTDAVTGIIDVEKASKSLRGELERLDKELKNVSQFDPGKKSELQKQYRDVEKSLKDLEKPLEDTKKKQDDLNKSQEEGVKTSKSIGKSFAEFAKQAGIVTLALGAVYKILSAVGTALKDTAKGMGTITRAQTIWNQAIYELSQLGKGESATLKELGEYSDRYIAFKLKQANVIQKNVILQNEYNDLMVQAADQSKTATQQAELLTKAEQKDQEIRQNKITNLKEELSLAKDLANRQKESLSAALNVKNIENQIIEIEGENRRLVSQRSSKEEKVYQDYLAWVEKWADEQDKAIDNQQKYQDKSLDLLKRYNEERINALSGQEQLDALRDLGIEELDEIRRQLARLGKITAEQELIFKTLGLNVIKAYYAGIAEQIELSGDEIERLLVPAIMSTFTDSTGLIIKDVEKEQAEIDFLASENEGKSLWDLIGIDPDSEDGAEAIEALKKGAETVKNIMDDIFDQRVEDARRNREFLDTQISETLAQLQMETELQLEGYANNVSAKKEELEKLKTLREQALAQEKAAIQAQQRFETLLQSMNLITSVSEIFKSLIKTLGPVGIPIAIAVSAAMIGAFVSAKAKAKKATAELAEGGSGSDTGIITGKRHSEGGEKFLDHVEVERGEQWGVLSRPASEKYGKVFHEMVSSFNKNEMPSFMPVTNQVRVDNSGPNSRLDKVNGSIKKLNESILKQSQVSFSGGKKIIRTGNKIRIIG